MKNGVLTLAATTAVLFGLTASASAQATPAASTQKPATSSPTTTTMPTFEFGAGYQLLKIGQVCNDDPIQQSCTPDRTLPIGVAVDGVRNFGALGLVGEGGWSYDTDTQDVVASPAFGLDFKTNVWHLAGGGRFTSRKSAKFWPYGQLLAGVVGTRVSGDAVDVLNAGDSSVSHTSFMLQPGAGATWVVGEGWGVFGQVDYRRVWLNDDDTGTAFGNLSDGRNDFRFVIGFRMILD